MSLPSTSRRLAALAALSLGAQAQTAQAQTALTPGHPDLTAAAPQSYEYDVRFVRETPQTIGQVTQTETLAGDRLTIVTSVAVPMAGQQGADTTVVAWPSLAPLSRAEHAGEEESVRLTFADGRIGGRSVLGNLDEAVDAALPAGAFSEGVAERIARSVPLRDGYVATFRVADKLGDVKTDTVRVVRQDGADWAVEHVSTGAPTQTYTVDGATREVRLVSFSPQAGMTIEAGAPLPRPDGPVLRPGDPALDTSWLRDQSATYVLRVVEPMQMDAGTTTTTRTVANGVVTVETTVEVPMQSMKITSTASADAATLAPVATATAGGPTATAVNYTPGRVVGTRTPASGDAAPVSADLEAPVFDATWAMEIAQSLPLTAGYTATVETYDADQGLQTVTYTVAGPEDGVYTVTAATPGGPVVYRVNGATRGIVSMRMSPQPGVTVEMAPTP